MRFVAGVLVGLVRQRVCDVCVMCVGDTCMPRVHAHPVLFVKEVGNEERCEPLSCLRSRRASYTALALLHVHVPSLHLLHHIPSLHLSRGSRSVLAVLTASRKPSTSVSLTRGWLDSHLHVYHVHSRI